MKSSVMQKVQFADNVTAKHQTGSTSNMRSYPGSSLK